MAIPVILSARDRSLLRLLSWTSATTALLLRGSIAFEDGPFADERRLRERLQVLAKAGFVRAWPAAHGRGGLHNYYKLTPAGFQALHGMDVELPPRSFFAPTAPAFFEHTLRLAEAIVETLRASHSSRVTIERFFREGQLTFAVGRDEVQPDCFFRFTFCGKAFNVAFELDQSTESLDSQAVNSIRQKLRVYDAYQEMLLADWRASGKAWERPRFRVAFLTRSVDRAYHILALARRLTVNKSRHLIYAATQDSYLGEADPLRTPLLLDHDGRWQALINLHPTAESALPSVRLPENVESTIPF